MKSPTSNVGIIELDGIRNGSYKNERTTKTINKTGKNERAYSTNTGSETSFIFELGLLPNSLKDEKYFNLKKMQSINLK